MSTSRTIATPIVDKNGKRTTVHKSDKSATEGRSTNSSTPPPPATRPSFIDVPELSEQQEAFFQDSKISIDGDPIPVYHGATVHFDSFDPTRVGNGNDTWGNGFYFTDQESIAKGYATESGSDTANVKEFYLNLTNPIYMDGKKEMSMNNMRFSASDAAKILKQHPDIYMQPNNEDGEMSFLGDYAPEYWDKESHTPQELDRMVDKVAREYFSDTGWVELEGVFGKEHGSAFLHAIQKTTGHDGVVVDFGEVGKHYVAWFPDQMKLTSNLEPDDSPNF